MFNILFLFNVTCVFLLRPWCFGLQWGKNKHLLTIWILSDHKGIIIVSQINVTGCLDLISEARTHPLCQCIHLEPPSFDFHIHNGKTERSILVILYLHFLACPPRAMQCSTLCMHAFPSFVMNTYLLCLNEPFYQCEGVCLCWIAQWLDWLSGELGVSWVFLSILFLMWAYNMAVWLWIKFLCVCYSYKYDWG